MTRYIYLVLACMLMSTVAYTQSQSIQGRIYDAKTNEGLPFANVILLKDGIQKSGTTTDLDGNYSFTGFDPGAYDVEAVYVGYPNARITGVSVSASQSVPLDIEMNEEQGVSLEELEVVVKAYRIPLIRQDETASGNTLGGEDIKKLPTRSVTTLIATTGGVSQDKEGTNVSFRGAREGDQIIYVDGVRVRGRSVPAQDIEQIQVITGGVPAAYGDVTGGVTNIITKGAASKFTGSIDLETSEYLDGYGYNFVTGSVSGPIWQRQVAGANGAGRTETILGFRVSGQFSTVKEPFPSYVGAYRAKDAYVDNLLANPVGANGLTINDITSGDVDEIKHRPNARDTDWSVNGKLDFVPLSGMSLTFGGQYFNSDAKQAYTSYRLVNYDRNPNSKESDWRAFARFRHKIGGNLLDLSDEEREARTSALIQNINYSLQFDISRNVDMLQDNEHKDNLFAYGYVGRVDKAYGPDYQFIQDFITPEGDTLDIARVHTTLADTLIGFDASSSANPALAAYFEGDILNEELNLVNGSFFGDRYNPFGLFISAGYPLNQYFETQYDQYGVSASGGFDIVGKGTENPSKHSIQFGISYEQRIDRFYNVGTGFSVGPSALWTLGRQLINGEGGMRVDSSNLILRDVFITPQGDSIDRFTYDYFNVETTFGQKFRDRHNIAYNDYVNIDSYGPDDLSLDMFTATDLIGDIGRINMSYQGYDYLGNQLGTDVTFEDFFTEEDGRGELTRPIAPSQPIYAAAYLQDKFSFKEMYFNIGVRVDRYDANQKVPEDPYSFYKTKTRGEVGGDEDHPESIGNDFVVYGDQGTNTITGYRDGEQWYTKEGNPVNDGTVIFPGGLAQPYLQNQDDNFQARDFVPTGFVDYEPQITVMPRISFSFPLSESAGFFAHYDVLSRRPSNSQASALDYYRFVRSNGGTIENPNLKPSKTIDYQVGFQQRVSESAAIKISAYYREQRDEVNQRQYLLAAPISVYTTYDNRDFGTVKGFSFAYDLRRTNNLALKANYTLQFADGTGSNSNSTRGSTSRGDLRVIYPYDYDQRHNLALSMDYRYGAGKGPTLFGKSILANTGLNTLLSLGSGRPFTPKSQVTPGAVGGTDGNARGGLEAVGGQFNGARLPWSARIDMRLDRDIRIGKADNKKPMYLNVYVRSQNVFNLRSIVQVYGYTQSPSDDGYLESPEGQTNSSTQANQETYEYLYGLRMANGAHYGLPRRIRIGASLTF